MTGLRHALCLLAVAAAAAAGCGDDEVDAGIERRGGTGERPAFAVVGARALEPPARTALQGVEERFRIDGSVDADGTAEGFDAFCTRRAVVALANREIRPEEAAACRRNEVGFVRLDAGFEAVAVYAPRGFGVDCLELEEVRGLFGARAEFQRYDMLDPELPSRRVRLVGPAAELAVTDLFVERALDDGVLSREVAITDEPERFGRTVEDRLALGYFGVGLDRLVDSPPKSLAIDAGRGCVRPTAAAVRSGRYHVARPLHIYASERGLDELPVRTLVVDILRRSADTLAPALVPLGEEEAERAIAAAIGAGRGAE